MKMIAIAALLFSGCVDVKERDEKNWYRVKHNADAAVSCIESGGHPHQNFWTEEVDGCTKTVAPAEPKEGGKP